MRNVVDAVLCAGPLEGLHPPVRDNHAMPYLGGPWAGRPAGRQAGRPAGTGTTCRHFNEGVYLPHH